MIVEFFENNRFQFRKMKIIARPGKSVYSHLQKKMLAYVVEASRFGVTKEIILKRIVTYGEHLHK